MNRMIIRNVEIKGNRVAIDYEPQGSWAKYFVKEVPFWVDYSINIEEVPENIAVIPFIGNILPMIWLFDAELVVEELDEDFFEAFDEIKKGYENMYPMVDFGGNVKVNQLCKNNRLTRHNERSAAFFSGGVDAFNTLYDHLEEHPLLFSVWGADVGHNNTSAWALVEKHIASTAESVNTNYITARTTFRRFVDPVGLTAYISPIIGDSWWHGIQHGIGLLSLIAPVAYVMNINHAYIGSSFTAEDAGKITCASDPTIDNHVKFCGTSIIHDGYERNRQMKIEKIVEVSEKHNLATEVRVCWQTDTGKNCSSCEKCFRTTIGFVAAGKDPREYGFNNLNLNMIKTMVKLRSKGFYPVQPDFLKSTYKSIQDAMNSKKGIEYNYATRWFSKADFDRQTPPFTDLVLINVRRALGKVKRLLRK